MKRGHSIAFAVMAVLAMVCAPLAAAGLGAGAEDTAIGTAFIPEPKEYLYDLWTDDNNVKILSVRASIGGSDLVEITGERTSKGPISGFWDFDRGTGLGPFNSFYAAINIADGLGEDNGERMLNHRAGTIAFVLDPYDLSKTLKGTTLTGTYNVMLVIPAVYWKADSNHLYISSSSSYKAGDMPVSGMVAYAHSLGDGKAVTNVFPYIGIGVYEATVVGDVLLSVSGSEPTADKTCDEFKSCADNAVPADGSAYQQWNFYQWTLYKMMSYAVMGTKNSQAMMGDGPVNNSAASETGLADSAGPYAQSTGGYSKLFIENPWGSLWEFVGDAAFCDKVLHAGNSLGGSALGEQTSEGASVARTGWITAASTDSSTWDLPVSSQSASNAGDLGVPGDYVWSVSGWRSLNVGGYWSRGSSAGVAYLTGISGLSFSDSNLGARLAYVMAADAAAPYSCSVALTVGDHVSVEGLQTGKYEVGSVLEFTVSVDEGYEDHLIVKADSVVLSPVNGTYSVLVEKDVRIVAGIIDGSVPEPKDYLYVIRTADGYNETITSVEASVGGGPLNVITGQRTSKGEISGFWDFDPITGMGPFNAFYAAINIGTGSGVDNGEQMLNHRAGTIAFVLDPYDLSRTIRGTELSGEYNVMLVIPAAYWVSDRTVLYISSSPSYEASGAEVPSGMKAYAHSASVGGTESVYPYIGIAVYEGTVVDSKLLSVSGSVPTGDNYCDQFKLYAANVAPADGSAYQQWNFDQWTLYKMMSYAVMGTKNSQAMMGVGPNNCVSETGLSDAAGPYAQATDGYSKLFIENPWGSLGEFIGSTWFVDGVVYAGNVLGGSNLGTKYSMSFNLPSDSGWIHGSDFSSAAWDFPTNVGGDNSLDLGASGDYFYVVGGNGPLVAGSAYSSNPLEPGVSFLNTVNGYHTSGEFFGSRLAYVMSEDAVAVIVVIDGMTFKVIPGKAELIGYSGDSAELTVPDNVKGAPVTAIAADAFNGCKSLTSIHLPETLTSIGARAFQDCESLTSLTIPDSVSSIGSGAFRNCTSLSELCIGESVRNIYDDAFENCPISSLVIGAENVGGDFNGIETLTSLEFLQNVKSIADGAFSGCSSLDSICIQNAETSVGNGAFPGTLRDGDSPVKEGDVSGSYFKDAEGTFNRVMSTVIIRSNDPSFGSVDLDEIDNVRYMVAVSTDENTLTIGGTVVTAVPAEGNEQYNYSFVRWDFPSTSVTGDMDVTAVFKRIVNQCTVTVVAQPDGYGTVSADSFKVDYGTAVTADGSVLTIGDAAITATPAEAAGGYSYEFVGWFIGDDQVQSGTIGSPVTFTAKFERNQKWVTLTFMSMGEKVKTREVSEDGMVGELPFVREQGYNLIGWFDNSGQQVFEGTEVVDLNSYTITAEWEAVVYSITYRDGAAILAGLQPSSYKVTDKSVVLPTDVPKSGYTFKGWYDNIGLEGNPVKEVDVKDCEDKVYYAKLIECFAVTLTVAEEGYGSLNPDKIDPQPEGAQYSAEGSVLTVGGSTITAIASDDSQFRYEFVGWFIGDDEVETGSISSPVTFTARFVKCHEVTVTAGEHTVIEGVQTGSYPEGSVLEFTVSAAGYVQSLEVRANGTLIKPENGIYSVAVNGDVAIVSSVGSADRYAVSISFTSASGSTSTSSFKFAYGTPVSVDGTVLKVGSVTMAATVPDEDERYTYSFSGWDFDGDEITGPTTISGVVTKVEKSFEVTILAGQNGSVTAGSVTVPYRTPIYASGPVLHIGNYESEAVPDPVSGDVYYAFGSWDLSTSQVTAPLTVTASFEERSLLFVQDGVRYRIVSDDSVAAVGYEGSPVTLSVPSSVVHDGKEYVPASIAENAFAGCLTATSACIGDSVKDIGTGALDGPSLKSIEVSEGNGAYSSVAGVLYDKNVGVLIRFPASKQRLVIPSTVTEIAAGAFKDAGSALKAAYDGGEIAYFRYISIPSSVTSIGEKAFADSTLETLKFEDRDGAETTRVGGGAFSGCASLNYVVFPGFWLSAEPDSFSGCVFLWEDGSISESYTVEMSGHKFTGKDSSSLKVYVPPVGGTFSHGDYSYKITSSAGSKEVVLTGFANGASRKDLTVFDNVSYLGFEWKVTSIGSKAFMGNADITSVHSMVDVGFKAFANCPRLETVLADDYISIGSYAFANCKALSTLYGFGPFTIGESSFSGCSSLTNAFLDKAQSIGKHAFYGCALTTADLSSAKTIGYGAFTGNALTSVTFSENLSSVDSKAFYGYKFYDKNGSKLSVTASSLAGLSFEGAGKALREVVS